MYLMKVLGFTGDEFNRREIFLEDTSNKTIEKHCRISPPKNFQKVAFCKQNKNHVNEAEKVTVLKRCNNLYYHHNLDRNSK